MKEIVANSSNGSTPSCTQNSSACIRNLSQAEFFLRKAKPLKCFLQKLTTASSTMARVARVASELRKIAFAEEHFSGTSVTRHALVMVPSLICSTVCESCALRLLSTQNVSICKDLSVAAGLALSALFVQPNHTRRALTRLHSLTARCASVEKPQASNTPQLCFRQGCPFPLKSTDNPSHWLQAGNSFVSSLQNNLLHAFNYSKPSAFFKIPCGMACENIFVDRDDARAVDSLSGVLGVISVGFAIFALVAFFVNRRKITAIPIHVTVAINTTGLISTLATLPALLPAVQKKVACHGDGTLRFGEPTAFNGCSFQSTIMLFSTVLMSFLFICMAHSWFVLANSLQRTRTMLARPPKVRIEAIYFGVSFALAITLTAAGMSRKDISGQLILNGCIIGHETVLYFMTIPMCCATALVLCFLCIGLQHLRQTFKTASKSVRNIRREVSTNMQGDTLERCQSPASYRTTLERGQSPASPTRAMSTSSHMHPNINRTTLERGQSPASPYRAKPTSSHSNRTTTALKKQIRRFFVYLSAVVVFLTLLVYTHVSAYLDAARIEDGLTKHLSCVLLSCSTKDCPAIPKAKLEDFVLVAILYNLNFIVLTSWMLEWRFWVKVWPFSIFAKHIPVSRSGSILSTSTANHILH